MQLIEAGDFHHTIIYKGNDELTDLARQLNHLRNALYDNMLKEEEDMLSHCQVMLDSF